MTTAGRRSVRALASIATGTLVLAALTTTPVLGSRITAATLPAGQVMVSSNVHHDTSPPLRSIPDSATRGIAHPALRSGTAPSTTGPSSPDTSRFTRAPRIPATTVNFSGIGANGSAPPDNDGAAGTTQYVELVNSEFEVFNKSGGVVLGARATNTLWSGFGGGCQTNNDGDGTVVWDTMSQRWFIQQFSVSTTPYLDCLAISTTSDATGTWNRYSFSYSSFPDYPKTGVWPDAYYASFNLFNAAGTQGLGTELCAYNRSQMLTGASATQQCFMATSSGEHTYLPATLDGTTQPPAGAPEWFVGLASSGASALGYFRFHVDWTTPANSSLTAESTLAVAAFAQACGGGTCIPQSGTSQQLDSLGDRVMYRLAYRNFGDHEAMVVNHSVTAGSSVGVRWYELRPSGSALTVFQQGTVAPDSAYRWMGSIAMDKSNDMALGYSVSSSSLHPGIRYTGRLSTDAAGTMGQGEATIITGAGSQSGSSLSRWGDYTEMTVDPADDCTFWYVNEYEASTGAFNWSTRIASFKFPSCGGVAGNDFSISANPNSVSSTPGGSATSTISTAVISGSAESVSLSASGLPSGATASFNPASVTAGGSSTLTISTTTSTSTGSSTVTVTGTSASATHSTTVTLSVTNPGGGGITNGGFETGNLSGWTSAGSTSVVSSDKQAGTYSARVGATTPTNGDSSVSQTFTVPSGGTALQFYYNNVCPDTVTYDWATATLRDNTTGTTTTPLAKTCVNPSSGWKPVNATVTAGHSYTLTLISHDDNYSSDPTYTDYDSVSITGSAPASDFSISANPTSVSVLRGSSGSSTISTAVTSGSAQTVNLSASGLPSGATASFNPTSVTAGGSSTLTLSTTSSTPTGTFTITVTGTGTSATHSATVSLTVFINDFSISASPNSVSTAPGGSATSTISTAVTSGSAQTISLSASGLPSGASASFNPASVTAGGSSTLTISTTTSTPPSTSTVTVTGTSASATHSTTVTLTVTNPGGGGITNGGFETGNLTGWTSAGTTSVVSSDKQAGTYSARVGATTPTNGDSSVSQTFTVPSGGTGLQFYYNNVCPDTLTYDWATATLKDNTAGTTTTPLAKTCANPSGWKAVTAAVTAGHSYTLTLISHDDNYSSDPTYTDYDSVSITSSAPPPALTQVSSDPYTDANAEHATQVEPDTLSNGSTIVSAFQTGRFNNGGADDIGWATSTNGGATWSHGFLPGLTTIGGGSPNLGWARVSDPSVAYDAKHGVWLISGLTIDSGANGRGVSVSRSTDGVTWQNAGNAISQTTDFFDKDWIACDSTSTSAFYGNCYIEFDDNSQSNTVRMLTSSDGGLTWSVARGTADTAHGLGGQPLVQPNGTVVVPYLADGAAQIRSFTSTDGGTTWGSSVLISAETTHAPAGGFRTSPLPSAEIDAAGTVYVAWQDCRFRSGCPANDIVMSTSANGSTWSAVVRVPIDATGSGVDHFVPGLGVDATSSGATAHLALYYYYYPTAACGSSCQLAVGYVSSSNGGSTWSAATQVAGPFSLSTIAPTSQGPMVGDYISTSFLNGRAWSVFAVGVGSGSPLNEAMYTVTGGLAAPGGRHAVDTATGAIAATQGPSAAGGMTAY